MSELKDLENKSLYIIREANAEFKKSAVLWKHGQGQHCHTLALSQGFLQKDSLPGDSYRHGIQV